MIRHFARRATRVAVLGAATALVAACDTDRATVTAPYGNVIYGARLTPAGINLPTGSLSLSADGNAVYVQLSGLESLSTGAYHVWLADVADDGATNVVPATGDLEVIVTDTTFSPEGDPIATQNVYSYNGVSSFANGGARTRFFLSVPVSTVGARTVAFVTIEPAAATAPTMTGPRPLWSEELADVVNADVEEAILSFGTYEPGGESYVYVPTGRGYGSFLGNVLMIADSSLTRPPVGYFYGSALLKRNAQNQVQDAAALWLGEHTAPYPRRGTSLRDADVEQVDPVVLATSIVAAGSRYEGDGEAPFQGFSDLVVTLETKQGLADRPSPSFVLFAPVPGIVSNPTATP